MSFEILIISYLIEQFIGHVSYFYTFLHHSLACTGDYLTGMLLY